MKILYVLEDEFDFNQGGMATQMRQYINGALKRKLYVKKISVSQFEKGINETFDIIHLCDVSVPYDLRKLIIGLRKIDRNKSKIVLSTIYWDFDDYFKNGSHISQRIVYRLFGSDYVERISSFIKFLSTRKRRYLEGFLIYKKELQCKLGSSVDLLLPNSYGEAKLFKKKTGATSNYKVIYNGVFGISQYTSKIRDIDILCVARIDRRKNQLQIAKEFAGTDYIVKFIGPVGPNSKKYFKELQKLINENNNLEYLGVKTQEELDLFYSRTKYHCLLSWVETPGLVNLDAFSKGCEVIVADKGSVKEYFGSAAFYVEIQGRRGQIIEIINAKRKIPHYLRQELTQKILMRYNWSEINNKLFETYKNLIQ